MGGMQWATAAVFRCCGVSFSFRLPLYYQPVVEKLCGIFEETVNVLSFIYCAFSRGARAAHVHFGAQAHA